MQWYAANAEGLSIWAGYLGRKKDFHWRKTCPIFFSEGLEDFVLPFFLTSFFLSFFSTLNFLAVRKLCGISWCKMVPYWL